MFMVKFRVSDMVLVSISVMVEASRTRMLVGSTVSYKRYARLMASWRLDE